MTPRILSPRDISCDALYVVAGTPSNPSGRFHVKRPDRRQGLFHVKQAPEGTPPSLSFGNLSLHHLKVACWPLSQIPSTPPYLPGNHLSAHELNALDNFTQPSKIQKWMPARRASGNRKHKEGRTYEAALLQNSKAPHPLRRHHGRVYPVPGACFLHDLPVPYAGVSGLALFGGSLELKEA